MIIHARFFVTIMDGERFCPLKHRSSLVCLLKVSKKTSQAALIAIPVAPGGDVDAKDPLAVYTCFSR